MNRGSYLLLPISDGSGDHMRIHRMLEYNGLRNTNERGGGGRLKNRMNWIGLDWIEFELNWIGRLNDSNGTGVGFD